MRRYGYLGVAVLAFCTSGCGGVFGPLVKTGTPSIFRNPDVRPIEYKAIATIGADDSSPTLRMSVIVRERLKEAGISAVRRAGRWTTEEDALIGICASNEEPKVQGVVIVSYDTLILRECSKREVAYRIVSNGRFTITQLADHLADFIKSTNLQALQGTPAQN